MKISISIVKIRLIIYIVVEVYLEVEVTTLIERTSRNMEIAIERIVDIIIVIILDLKQIIIILRIMQISIDRVIGPMAISVRSMAKKAADRRIII